MYHYSIFRSFFGHLLGWIFRFIFSHVVNKVLESHLLNTWDNKKYFVNKNIILKFSFHKLICSERKRISYQLNSTENTNFKPMYWIFTRKHKYSTNQINFLKKKKRKWISNKYVNLQQINLILKWNRWIIYTTIELWTPKILFFNQKVAQKLKVLYLRHFLNFRKISGGIFFTNKQLYILNYSQVPFR